MGYGKPALLPTPAQSQVLPSSTTQSGHNKAQADSSKKEKVTCSHLSKITGSDCFCPFCQFFKLFDFFFLLQKQQIQEKAINEVKTAIKPFYQKKEITKEEYKEIVRKAVEKVNAC